MTTMKRLEPHDNGNRTLTLDGEPMSVSAALFHSRHVSIQFQDGELVYPGGIASEIKCFTDNYEEVTQRFQAQLGDQFQFHGNENHTKQWFHRAEFWPYEEDSSDNLYHYIRCAATHHDDPDIHEPHVEENVNYPFSEHPVFTYFDQDENRVRVFAGTGDDAIGAADVMNGVLQPRLRVFMSTQTEQDDGEHSNYEVTICAVPIANYDDPKHNLETLSAEYVTSISELELKEEYKAISANPDSGDSLATLEGDLWEIIVAMSKQEEPWLSASIEPQTSERFSKYRWFL